ncbi:hypothetical protein ES708_14545 [subsurface metagenome]
MAPGPITAVTVGNGTKSPHAGALIAVGHAIVEFPLMICIYLGLGNFLRLDSVKAVVFTLGGLFLLIMGADMLRSIKKVSESSSAFSEKPLVAGMLLSMGNVYFLLWWATVGATLITKAVAFGLIGIIAFTLVHWLCDLIWLYFLSAVSYKGGHVFGIVFQKVIFAVCGVTLIIFGGVFLFDAVRLW